MGILKTEELETEEQRHNLISESFLSEIPSFPGFKCVRDITPLVMVALQRANNPYVTGQKGFEAAGIGLSFAGGKKKKLTEEEKKASISFAMAMMPKTAEVLVLLTCTRDDLKRFAKAPSDLEDAALDIVDGSTMEAMAAATVFISERLKAISKSRATNSPEDDKPSAVPPDPTSPKEPAPTG